MTDSRLVSAQLEARLTDIQEKWRSLALSWQPIDRTQAEAAVRAVYAFLRLNKPRILFFDSPDAAMRSPEYAQLCQRYNYCSFVHLAIVIVLLIVLLVGLFILFILFLTMASILAVAGVLFVLASVVESALKNPLLGILVVSVYLTVPFLLLSAIKKLFSMLSSLAKRIKVPWKVNWVPNWSYADLLNCFTAQVKRQEEQATTGCRQLRDWLLETAEQGNQSLRLSELIKSRLFQRHVEHSIQPMTLDRLCGTASILEFCISQNYPHNPRAWAAFQMLLQHCGWVYFGHGVCLVCDRPTQILFDADNRVHAIGEPAIKFADGFGVYVYHGIVLPEKYGAVSQSEWLSEWLLTEENSQLRRMLIDAKGIERLCQDLNAECIDTWREYELLSIPMEPEPFHILKMTCPSTNALHFLMVPPEIYSAREAICWVNWDIDPEEFEVET